jgi:hypothetical protein
MIAMSLRMSLLLLVVLTSAGCALPDYYTPGGHSSTARKRMNEARFSCEMQPDTSQPLPGQSLH